jgi:alkylation response protein AidB-like acyl-CoA dehydrogenase
MTEVETTGLVERVRDLRRLLRENQARCERERRVVTENIDALSDAGVFRMTVPHHFGGFESSLLEQYEVLAEISRGCPSTAWVATVITSMLWNAALFPDRAQEEVFTSARPRVASVFAPEGTASKQEGGYVVSGRWRFNTGCHHADWAIMSAVLEDGGRPEQISFLIPYDELTIVDDWFASGLAGSGSNTTVADRVFVPEHRSLSLARQVALDLPSERNRDNPYYLIPRVSYTIAQAAGAPVGLARGAVDAFLDWLPGRKIRLSVFPSQLEAPVTHAQLGEAAMRIESADAHGRRAAELVDRLAGRPLPLETRARIRAHVGFATRSVREAVDILFQASGASAIVGDVPIQRYQRDIQALANHAGMTASTSVELYGRVLLGLPVDSLTV